MAVSGRVETRILRVRTTDDGGVIREFEFDQAHWYLVTDRHPQIEFLVQGHHLAGAGGKNEELGQLGHVAEEDPSVPTWVTWHLGKLLSRERRMGGFAYPLRVPENHALRCYVVPVKLLEPEDYLAMVQEVEQESGKPALWDARRVNPRAWVERRRLGIRPYVESLLQQLSDEMGAARSLSRVPLEPVVGPGRRLIPPPEQALVARWASRRMHHVAVAIDHIASTMQRELGLSRESMPSGRKRPLEEERRHLEKLRVELRVARARMAAYVKSDQLGAPFAFGPLAQRDHRLRRLLGVFDPSRREIPMTARQRSWSRMSPTTFNDLFERWGAVWIVQQLRAMGFTGDSPETVGADRLRAARWRLARGEVRVTMDYEAHPPMLGYEGLPPVDERRETAIEWIARQHMVNPERPIFGTESHASPDYLLRFEGPGGKALAVGDATLADPDWHPEKSDDNKVTVVAGYRRSLFWWTGDEVVPCDPMGAFALFLGPPEQWSAFENHPKAPDVWLICPRPRGDDELAAARFRRFIERLLERVSLPGN